METGEWAAVGDGEWAAAGDGEWAAVGITAPHGIDHRHRQLAGKPAEAVEPAGSGGGLVCGLSRLS